MKMINPFWLLLEILQSPDFKIEKLEGFKISYKQFKTSNKKNQDNLQEFFRCKKSWSQLPLLSSMKDHALQGDHFKQFKLLECHLDNDVLLLYKFNNHTLTLVLCCCHSDIYGPNAKALVNKLKAILK